MWFLGVPADKGMTLQGLKFGLGAASPEDRLTERPKPQISGQLPRIGLATGLIATGACLRILKPAELVELVEEIARGRVRLYDDFKWIAEAELGRERVR
jgi:hypothetical protein